MNATDRAGLARFTARGLDANGYLPTQRDSATARCSRCSSNPSLVTGVYRLGCAGARSSAVQIFKGSCKGDHLGPPIVLCCSYRLKPKGMTSMVGG